MKIKIRKFASDILKFDFSKDESKLKAKDFKLDMNVYDLDMNYQGRIVSKVDTVGNLISDPNSNIKYAASQYLSDYIDGGGKGNPKAKIIVVITKDMRSYKAIPFSNDERKQWIAMTPDAVLMYNKIIKDLKMDKDIDTIYLKKAVLNKLSK